MIEFRIPLQFSNAGQLYTWSQLGVPIHKEFCDSSMLILKPNKEEFVLDASFPNVAPQPLSPGFDNGTTESMAMLKTSLSHFNSLR